MPVSPPSSRRSLQPRTARGSRSASHPSRSHGRPHRPLPPSLSLTRCLLRIDPLLLLLLRGLYSVKQKRIDHNFIAIVLRRRATDVHLFRTLPSRRDRRSRSARGGAAQASTTLDHRRVVAEQLICRHGRGGQRLLRLLVVVVRAGLPFLGADDGFPGFDDGGCGLEQAWWEWGCGGCCAAEVLELLGVVREGTAWGSAEWCCHRSLRSFGRPVIEVVLFPASAE